MHYQANNSLANWEIYKKAKNSFARLVAEKQDVQSNEFFEKLKGMKKNGILSIEQEEAQKRLTKLLLLKIRLVI